MLWLAILVLLLTGLALLVIEIIFVPGTTFVGLVGGALLILGVMLSFNKFGNTIGFYVLAATLLASAVAVYLGLKSGAWNKFALKSTIDSKVNEGSKPTLKTGDQGITLSSLKPFGNAEFNNVTYEVKTISEFVEPGKKVKIVDVNAERIIVEQII